MVVLRHVNDPVRAIREAIEYLDCELAPMQAALRHAGRDRSPRILALCRSIDERLRERQRWINALTIAEPSDLAGPKR